MLLIFFSTFSFIMYFLYSIRYLHLYMVRPIYFVLFFFVFLPPNVFPCCFVVSQDAYMISNILYAFKTDPRYRNTFLYRVISPKTFRFLSLLLLWNHKKNTTASFHQHVDIAQGLLIWGFEFIKKKKKSQSTVIVMFLACACFC